MSDTVAPEEGKFYRTRSGEKVGPFVTRSTHGHGARAFRADGRADDWHSATGLYNSYRPEEPENSKHDLVAEWVDTVASAEPARYTLDEIDRLRDAIYRRQTEGLEPLWDPKELEKTVERRLRTAIAAGVRA